jgi:hypothetical protein
MAMREVIVPGSKDKHRIKIVDGGSLFCPYKVNNQLYCRKDCALFKSDGEEALCRDIVIGKVVSDPDSE